MEWLCIPPPTDVEGVLNEMRKLVKQSDTIVKTFAGDKMRWIEKWRIGRMRSRFSNLRQTIRRFRLTSDENRRYVATVSEFKSAQTCIDMLTGDFVDSEQCLVIDSEEVYP
jgi:hypothetical protein